MAIEVGQHAGSDHSSVPKCLARLPDIADADLHFRKDAEKVPVFRRLIRRENEFGCQIAGIVGTSGIICARRDFWDLSRNADRFTIDG
jgi:hypothetical protein